VKLIRKPAESEIPTASMADIAFLLIIFFMVTAVFSATKGLDFKLPKEENKEADTEEAVFIKIGADASVSVDCQAMEASEILAYLEPKLTRDPNKPVILYTDPQAPYQAMIAVYDELGSAKDETHGFRVRNIAVPTQSEVMQYIELFGFNPFESTCAGG
jgi:biopolymer transport protein ExbD